MFPHLQAAFIGIGSEKNAFLHFSDLSTPNKIKPPANKNRNGKVIVNRIQSRASRTLLEGN